MKKQVEEGMDPHLFALEVDQLMVSYDKVPVLWDISLKIPQGLLVGIIGPNGAGKSSLLKAVLGLVEASSGKIEFLGNSLKNVRQQVAYVPQRESVDWDFPLTVKDLVIMGRYGKLGLMRRPREADSAAADFYLDQVGMLSYADRQIGQLSGGQQQRAFIARAMAQEASIYFMDEPFAGIDLATESLIIQLLKKLKEKGKTIFIVHHDLSTIERYFDWIILLNTRLVAYGETALTFTSENLNNVYGKNYSLLDEAFKLSMEKQIGIKR